MYENCPCNSGKKYKFCCFLIKPLHSSKLSFSFVTETNGYVTNENQDKIIIILKLNTLHQKHRK
ncbi:SEC-C domain-containing protein [Bacillus sp. 17RED48]|uniref:SEC-C metal-binding domain-containing protein n=1 Tax=Bacillus sp. 17RED48 TaxID=2778093 RepID=UPI001C9A9723|nr:SEC-C metal-binding domain-containing protein [Bacillus sp. 17RED48]MBY7110672.1 SEC-C domain-containing protein [Bacillus sp. 17RED48]